MVNTLLIDLSSNHKKYSTALGSAFIIYGMIGFLLQGLIKFTSTTTIFNTTALIAGGILTTAGIWSNVKWNKVLLRITGMSLLMFGILGLFRPEPFATWFSPTILNVIIALATGLLTLIISKCELR